MHSGVRPSISTPPFQILFSACRRRLAAKAHPRPTGRDAALLVGAYLRTPSIRSALPLWAASGPTGFTLIKYYTGGPTA